MNCNTTHYRANSSSVPGDPNRFEDVAQKAKRIFTEGKETPRGGWQAARTDVAINEFRPAQMALAWTDKQQLRGITVERPPQGNGADSARFIIDAWIGEGSPASPDALNQDKSWRTITESHCDHTPMILNIDFDGIVETSALRIRFVNVLKDFGKFVAGFDSIVAFHPIGGESKELPVDLSQRVSVFKLPPIDDDKAMATLDRHIPFNKPGDLRFDSAGVLHCVSDGQVVTIPLKEGESSRVVIARDKLKKPLALAFTPDGLLGVTDKETHDIQVFDPKTGALVKTIGEAGGIKPGKWNPNRMDIPTGLAFDSKNRAWVTDWCMTPKRVVRFGADGKAEKEFLGPTEYGGGGTMDSKDRRFIYYRGMKFVIDWNKLTWTLDSVLGERTDRTVYLNNKRYLVGPVPGSAILVTVAEEKDGVAKFMVQAGSMKDWPALKTSPELREKFGGLDLKAMFFVWSDLNGDRIPQPDEVQVLPFQEGQHYTIGEDLSILHRSGALLLRPVKFQPDGVPVYDVKKAATYNGSVLPGHNDNAWGDDKGRIFMTGAKLIDTDGQKMLWNYPNKFNVHEGFYQTGFGYNRPPGVLNQEHSPIGHIKVGKEEYFITNTDESDWFCYSADGLLVGCILGGPTGYGKKAWSMPQWEHGLDLSDLRPGQEHYQGCVVAPDDGHVYAIAGHNHISVVRVDGLEQAQRVNGEFKVNEADIEKARAWAIQESARLQTATAPKVAKMLFSGGAPEIDAFLGDWPEDLFVTVAQTVKPGMRETKVILDCSAALAFDSKNLYVAMKVHDESPLRNNAEDPLTLFKNGDAAEVTLRCDPAATAKDPVAGDLRLLFAKVKGRSTAVLYKPIDPSAPKEAHREFSSPVSRFQMDRVEVIKSAKIAFELKKFKDGQYWLMEASVPWEALGQKAPTIGAKLRGDFGYLESDENGTQTVARRYWSGVGQTVISDLPSEARLHPSLWGTFEVINSDAKMKMIVSKKNVDLEEMLKSGAGAKELDDILK